LVAAKGLHWDKGRIIMFGSIQEMIVNIPVVLFAITVHEYAHARAALFLGDPTAKLAGRLTFNPLSHLDLIGAICLYLFQFGWAKPVPINPRYFKNPRTGSLWVSLAGPAANFASALLAGIIIRYFLFPSALYLGILVSMLLLNIALGLFNLLPIPPLDGSHILETFLPYTALQKYREIARYAPLILLGVFLADRFLRTGIISGFLSYPVFYLAHLFAGDNFFRLIGIF
jgi:Zn-dependent protease